MPVRIDAKGSKFSDSTKDHIEECCGKLNQFFNKIIDIEVILDTQEKHKHATKIEIVVRVPGQRLAGTRQALTICSNPSMKRWPRPRRS